MGSITRFGALFSKVKALQSRMLTESDYEALLRAESEVEVIDYLVQRTDYGKGVKLSGTAETQPVALERVLQRYLFTRYERMMYYLIDEERRLFKTLLMRYEIESLKMVIRTVYSQTQNDDFDLTITTSRYFQIRDFDQLLKCETLDALVDSLATTSYGDILRPYLNESKDRILFYMEMNLDRYYFKKLSDSIADLTGEGHAFMENSLGVNVDFLNIQWIYRGLKHFKLSAEELFNYCLKGGKYLNLSRLKKLCYATDNAAFIRQLLATHYKSEFDGNKSIDLIIERDMERALYSLFHKQVQEAHFNLITPVGYLHALEFEIRDIFAILEAKRYQMDAEQTRSFLVRQFD